MRLFTGLLVGLGLLVSASQTEAQFEAMITHCETAPHGGICQIPLRALESREERIIVVEMPGVTCFPRVVNQRVSNGPGVADDGPFVVFPSVTSISVPLTTQTARISWFVHNTGLFRISHPWLGFIWQCEGEGTEASPVGTPMKYVFTDF